VYILCERRDIPVSEWTAKCDTWRYVYTMLCVNEVGSFQDTLHIAATVQG
jgi:hypothetical protein